MVLDLFHRARSLFIDQGLQRLFSFSVERTAHLLAAPVVTQQVAGDLEKKGARLVDLSTLAPVQPLGEGVLGQVGGVGGAAQALAEELQQLGMEGAVGAGDGAPELLIHGLPPVRSTRSLHACPDGRWPGDAAGCGVPGTPNENAYH